MAYVACLCRFSFGVGIGWSWILVLRLWVFGFVMVVWVFCGSVVEFCRLQGVAGFIGGWLRVW